MVPRVICLTLPKVAQCKMTWALLGANALLAIALLLFVREARQEWSLARVGRERTEARLSTLEERVSECDARLEKYFRQLRGMQEQMGWSDDHAWTKVLKPWPPKKQ